MNVYEITITEIDREFVSYTYSGVRGTTGRKWFPNVKLGQVWKMTCNGALVISCEFVK